jgi:hypothetical protein
MPGLTTGNREPLRGLGGFLRGSGSDLTAIGQLSWKFSQ